MFLLIALTSIMMFAVISISGCKKNPAEPDDEEKPDSVIRISATKDESRAVSLDVKASEGGVLSAQDKDGIAFQLSIPPGALQQDLKITVTPYSDLSIGGLGGNQCSTCSSNEKNCCQHGVVIEPSGLQFDSTILLTITYPASNAFPFEKAGVIAYIDPVTGEYDVCPTQTYPNERKLIAKISHFSGYACDEANHDRLKEDMEDAFGKLGSPTGSTFWPNLAYIWQLLAIYDVCGQYTNLDDLRSAIENGLYNLYEARVNWVIENSNNRSDCEALYIGSIDGEVFRLANSSNFKNLDKRLETAYMAALDRVVASGESACKSGNCQQGVELLSCARSSYIGRGAPDQSKMEQLNIKLSGCCTNLISLTASNTSVRFLVSDLSDISSAYTILTAKLTDLDGKPLKDRFIDFFYMDEQGNRHSITNVLTPPTDENGEVRQIAFASGNFNCNTCAPVEINYFASFEGSVMGPILSEPVTITEVYPKVEITINFNWEQKTYTGDNELYSSETVTATGTLNHCATTVYPSPQPGCACNGVVTKSYSSFDMNGNSCSIVPADQTMTSCGFDVQTLDTLVTVPGYNRPVRIGYIKNIRAGVAPYLQMNKTCTDSQYNTYPGVFDYCGIYWHNCFILLPNDGAGNFQESLKQEPFYQLKLSGRVYY